MPYNNKRTKYLTKQRTSRHLKKYFSRKWLSYSNEIAKSTRKLAWLFGKIVRWRRKRRFTSTFVHCTLLSICSFIEFIQNKNVEKLFKASSFLHGQQRRFRSLLVQVIKLRILICDSFFYSLTRAWVWFTPRCSWHISVHFPTTQLKICILTHQKYM